MTDILISKDHLNKFIKTLLLRAGGSQEVSHSLTQGLLHASLRGVDSHGIRLLPHYIKGIQGGRINPKPNYTFTQTSSTTALLDADHTFGHASAMEAAKKAIEISEKAGSAHVAIYNSSHFGAASYYALEIAKHDRIGMSFTNTDALIQTVHGKRSFLGNNPICIAVPCQNEEPLCLDMATSRMTFNKVKQFKEKGIPLPEGVGVDKNGVMTQDPNEVAMLTPIGGYKGFGLSMMIEILCGLLAGMPYGPDIPKMFEAPLSQKRYLSHFVTALRVDCFQPIEVFKRRVSEMMMRLRNEPKLKEDIPIQVPGDPEKKMMAERIKNGIPLTPKDIEAFTQLSLEYDLPLHV